MVIPSRRRQFQCHRSSLAKWLMLVASLAFWSRLVVGDIFSSHSHLDSLSELERHLVSSLTDYVQRTERRLDAARRYLEEFAASADGSSGSLQVRPASVSPVQGFQLIRRLSVDLGRLQNAMKPNPSESDRSSSLTSGRRSVECPNGDWSPVDKLLGDFAELLPTRNDLSDAALGLIRLQDTYRLNATDLTRGRLFAEGTAGHSASGHSVTRQVSREAPMTARDCLYLAKTAYSAGYYGLSLDWFDAALDRAHSEGNSTASVEEILLFHKMAIETHEIVQEELRRLNAPLKGSEKLRVLEYDNEDFQTYQQLCRGERLEDIPRNWRDEKCFLYSEHAWFRLQPVRVEQHSADPLVWVFHDVLTSNETETLKRLAEPTLTRARVLTDDQPEEVSRVRVSSTAWFSASSHPLVRTLNRRIEALTGLSADMSQGHCELLQVANYGVGGHYVPHYDYLFKDRPEEEWSSVDERERRAGDRIATFMIYLSDVPLGGSTVFTRLNIQVSPKAGSALFWYNLYRNGNARIDTVHGACPVLLGEKWVANYWLREHGQTFRRRCGRSAEE